ncbi:MAG: hypothetical protein V8T86_06170 [Victivallis sp.]
MRWYNTILPREFTLLHFENALSDKIVLPSIVNSLHYSLLAMVIAVAVGVLVSLAAVRWKLWRSTLADLLAMPPLAVPGIIIAFGYLGMSVRFKFARRNISILLTTLFPSSPGHGLRCGRRRMWCVRFRRDSSRRRRSSNTPPASSARLRCDPAESHAAPRLPPTRDVGALFAFSFSMLEVSTP